MLQFIAQVYSIIDDSLWNWICTEINYVLNFMIVYTKDELW